VFTRAPAGSSRNANHPGQLLTEQLPGQYAQFGELAGVV
jgi:hypothetical protein